MSKLLREASTEIRQGNFTMREQLRMYGNLYLNKSELSAQEAVYYVMSLPLSMASRSCVFFNTNRSDKRVAVVKSKSALQALDPGSIDIFVKSQLDNYCQRPSALDDLYFADFVAWYTYSSKPGKNLRTAGSDVSEDGDVDEASPYMALLDESGYVKKRNQAKIIRFCNFNELDPEYRRENVMLFLPFRNESSMEMSCSEDFDLEMETISTNKRKYVFDDNLWRRLQEAQERMQSLESDVNDNMPTPRGLKYE